MTVELTVAIGIACTVLGSVATLAAKKRAERHEATEEGKNNGVVLTEIGYIKSGIDDIKRKHERMDAQFLDIATRVTAVEASADQAHKRLDDHLSAKI